MQKARRMGAHIKYLAEQKGVSNKELASVLGCTETNVLEFYQGWVYPSYGQMLALSKKLNVSINEIVNPNEALYNSLMEEELGEFSDVNNREKILDIIENYYDLAKAIQY